MWRRPVSVCLSPLVRTHRLLSPAGSTAVSRMSTTVVEPKTGDISGGEHEVQTSTARLNGRVITVTHPVGLPPTLLEAAAAEGIGIPTLCYYPNVTNHRAVCRVCLVEVNGKLRPACATPLSDGDTVQTHSPEVDAYRRRDVEMLLSRHPEDCMRCEVEHECRLRTVVNELQPARVAVTPRGRGTADSHRLHAQDHTSVAIDRDVDKCIDCNLCVDVCGAGGQEQYIFGMVERGAGMLQTTAFDRALADTQCISCGQCTLVCPTGALTEQSVWRDVLSALNARTHTTMVQVAPATRVALGEEFGLAPGSVSTGRLVRALRLLGFDLVFDTNFAADLTIMEETHELLGRVADPKAALPLFTSCCPAWVNYLELNRPDLLRHLSTTKSPQQMHGAVAKRVIWPMLAAAPAKSPKPTSAACSVDPALGNPPGPAAPQAPYIVSVMPCTAKKEEARRPSGVGDIDAVVTTRELARMIRSRGIPFASLDNSWAPFDSPLGESTGAAQIFGASGGVMEAAARTAQHLLREADPGRTADTAPPTIDFHPIRGVARGIKEAEVEGIGRVAVCNGIAAGMELLAQPDWKQRYVAVEVMACVGGCLGGGGEPKSMDPHVLSKRAAAIYAIDAKQEKRRSDQNAEVQQLYIDHLGGAPGSGPAHDLLHTDYAERRSPRSALARFLAAVDARDGAAAAALFVFDEGCEWDTGTTALGKLVGRRDIEACVNTELPPTSPTAPSIRHRLVDRAEGLDVRTPTGELCTFDVALDPVTGLIQSLWRRPDCVSRRCPIVAAVNTNSSC